MNSSHNGYRTISRALLTGAAVLLALAALAACARATPTPTPTPEPTQAVTLPKVDLPPASLVPALQEPIELMGQWAPEYTGRLEFTPLREVDGEYYAFQAVGDRIQLVTLNEAGFPEKTAVSFPLPEQAGSTVDLDWDEELLAVMDQEAHTAYFYDVSDPQAPAFAGSYAGPACRLSFHGGYLFLIQSRAEYGEGDDVDIIDVSDPAKPKHVGSYHVDGGDVTVVEVADNLAYVGLENRHSKYPMFTRLVILDISHPGSPRETGYLDIVEDSITAIEVVGDRVYLGHEPGGEHYVQIVDVSDPPTPKVLGRVRRDEEDIRGSAPYYYTEVTSIHVERSRLYVMAFRAMEWAPGVYWRLIIVDISDPNGPRELGRYEDAGVPLQLGLRGSRLLVITNLGLYVLDVGEPASPKLVERIGAGGTPEGVFLRGEYAFLFLPSGLFVLGLSDATEPQVVAYRDLGGVARVEPEDDGFRVWPYSYVSVGVDPSDPFNPRVDPTGDRRGRRGVFIGPYYYEPWKGHLEVHDTSNGKDELVAHILLAEERWSSFGSTAKMDDYVYMVGGGSVYVFHVSSPVEPDLLARKPLVSGQDAGEIGQVAIVIEDRSSYVLHGGLWVLDLSNPAKPVEVAYYPTEATVIDVEDGRIALGGADGAFALLRYSLGEEGP